MFFRSFANCDVLFFFKHEYILPIENGKFRSGNSWDLWDLTSGESGFF